MGWPGSKDVADRGKGLHVFEAKTAGRVNRKTPPFTACQSEQKGVDSSEARIIYEWLIFISPGLPYFTSSSEARGREQSRFP
jgi:hypothetical protein